VICVTPPKNMIQLEMTAWVLETSCMGFVSCMYLHKWTNQTDLQIHCRSDARSESGLTQASYLDKFYAFHATDLVEADIHLNISLPINHFDDWHLKTLKISFTKTPNYYIASFAQLPNEFSQQWSHNNSVNGLAWCNYRSAYGYSFTFQAWSPATNGGTYE